MDGVSGEDSIAVDDGESRVGISAAGAHTRVYKFEMFVGTRVLALQYQHSVHP